MEPIAEDLPQKLIPTPPVAVDVAVKRESRPLTMPQKQFNLLTQAFKGSANHVPSPHGRKPSMLKLSKRVDSGDSIQENHELEEPTHSIQVRKPSIGEFSDFQLDQLHSLNMDLSVPSNHAPFKPTAETPKVDVEDTVSMEPTEAEKQEKRLQELLQSIAFHTHTDQSISTIDVKVHAERHWLNNNPSSETWSEITQRVLHNRQEEQLQDLARQNEIANRFLDSAMFTGAMHVNNLLNGADNEKERLVVRLVFSLLNDTLDEIMTEVAAEITQFATQASTILNKSLVKSLASVSLGTEGSNSRFWKMSGREHVLKGALLDALRVPPRPPLTTEIGTNPIANAGSSGDTTNNNVAITPAVSTLHTLDADNSKNEIRTMQPRFQIPNHATIAAATVPPRHAPSLPVPPPVCDKIVHIPSMLPSATEEEEIGNGYDSDDSEADPALINNTTADNPNADTTNTVKHYLQELYNIEIAHWKGINFTSVINSPLQIPSTVATPNKYMSNYTNSSVKGVVTCMRIFPLVHALYTSLLVCGLCNGRVIVYSVRYTGQPAEILCTSALPGKADQAPIVDIKCGSSGVSSIICMNSLGVVNVLHVNTALCTSTPSALQPVPRKKWTLFRYKAPPKSNTMASVHSINSNDLVFTLPTLQETLNTSTNDAHDLSNLTMDSLTTGTTSNNTTKLNNNTAASILPTSICFHPSVTLFGSNVSIMVGAANGDVIKFNYDYVHNTVAAPIINITPFVHKEFIHPNNAVKGFVLTNGVNEKLGNKVYRELFHYHKSKIILMDVVNAISPYLISVDQSGRVALWHYDAKYLEGKCWFRPYCTTKLALEMVDVLPTGDIITYGTSDTINSTLTDDVSAEGPDTTSPADISGSVAANRPEVLTLSDDIIAKLVVRDAYVDTDNTLNSSGAKDRVCFVYEPIYDSERGVYVQYTAVEYTTEIESVTTATINPDNIPENNSGTALLSVHSSVSNDNIPTEATSSGGDSSAAVPSAVINGVTSSADFDNNDHQLLRSIDSPVAVDRVNSTEANGDTALSLPIVDPTPVPSSAAVEAAEEPVADESPSIENNNNIDAASDMDILGEKVDGDGIRVTTLSEDNIEPDDTVIPNAGGIDITDNIEVAATGAGDDTVNDGTDVPPNVEPKPAPMPMPARYATSEPDAPHRELILIEEEEEEEEEMEKEGITLSDKGPEHFGEDKLPDVTTDSSTDALPVNANANLDHIPVTVFTSLTALVEQYREQLLTPHNDQHVDQNDTAEEAEDETDNPTDANDHSETIDNAAVLPASTAGNPFPLLIPIPTPLPSTTTSILPVTPRASLASQTPQALTTKRVVEFTSATVLAERTLHFTIMSCKMSYDGAEVVMLLASRVNDSNTSADNLNDNNTTPNSTTLVHTVYYIIPYFPLTQKFHRYYPRLYLDSSDCVVDYCVGPLQFETLTRTVFVLTKKCVRLFSLHTGREIITTNSNITHSAAASGEMNETTNNNNDATSTSTSTSTPLPFTWALPSFAPTTIALCPSQRVLTLSAHDDTRIAVYLLQHSNDGSATLNTTENAELLNRFKLYEKIRPAEKTILPAAEGTGIHTVLNILTFIPPELQYITDEAIEIIDLVFDHIWLCIEMNQDRARRKGLIGGLYSTKPGTNDKNSEVNLGFIEPSVWPPLFEFPVLKISAEEEEVTPVVHTVKSPKAKKHKKKKDKKVKVSTVGSGEEGSSVIINAAESGDELSVLL